MRAAYRGPAFAGAAEIPENRLVRLDTRLIDTRTAMDAISPVPTSGRPSLTREGRIPCLVQFRGPVIEEWKDAVAQAGGLVRGYIPNNAFIVEVRPADLAQIAALAPVQWVGEYRPEDKVQPFLGFLQSKAAPMEIDVRVQTLDPAYVEAAAARIARLGGVVEAMREGRRWGYIRATLALAQIPELARMGEVEWIEEYVPPVLLNDFAVRGDHLNVTNIWSAHNLTGAGQVIGHADTGLDIGSTNGIHPDFAGRVRAAFGLGRPGNWSDPNGHGTHTAGSILGDGHSSTGQFRGVAWQAELVHQSVMDSGGGLGGLPADLNDLYLQAYTNGARIHSDSWGSSVYGQYTTDSRQTDEFMWDHRDMLIVFSAGNDGMDQNRNGVVDLDSMGSPATAKNLVSVGASESDRAPGSGGYSAYSYGQLWPSDYPVTPLSSDYVSRSADGLHQGMSAFSSRGPTDDGRIKPDVVAPGNDIVSCRSRQSGAGTGWGAHPNEAYTFFGGTSMACPLIAGVSALVRQYCIERAGVTNPSAALIKAMLIGGARSLAPGQYGTNQYLEVPPLPRPNMVEGWGQVDVEETLFPSRDRLAVVLDDEAAPLATGQTNLYRLNVAGTGRVTMALIWTDYPASAGSGVKLVNDLDLLVIGPGGVRYYPNHRAAPDRTNNVEVVEFSSATSGAYTVEVSGYNIPQGPQPYALVTYGEVRVAPVILHVPLENTFDTESAYPVEAQIVSSTPFDTNSAAVWWNLTGSTSVFHRAGLAWATGDVYRGFIPAQSNHSDVSYYLSVGSNQVRAVYPEGAPSTLLHFSVTDAVTLAVSGSPAPLYSVTPPYGRHDYAIGNTVRASTPEPASISPGRRIACSGWTGQGSVPASGGTNAVAFAIAQYSSLTWLWEIQYQLDQTSSVPGILGAETWWASGSDAQTLAAPLVASVLGTNYCFAQWLLDGLRQSDALGVAVNPVAGISMHDAHSAAAWYFPESQDSNENGMPDWWEYFYFGTLSVASNGDADADGFFNFLEYLDRTNPRDAGSYPRPPAIAHTALSDPQILPAPWTVQAVVTDNYRVAGVALHWSRNGGEEQSVSMQAGASGAVYAASISAPGVDGDAFFYRIEAVDPIGLVSTSGPHAFGVRYAGIAVQPASFGLVRVPAHSSSNLYLSISNSGSGPLSWRLNVDSSGLFDDMENGTNGWTHDGQNDLWHIGGGTRFASPTHAWYCGNEDTRKYVDSMNASLVTPPVKLGDNARLTFNHWARMEYDSDQMNDHYWDGGIVELSTNRGATFFQIAPVGGYPYRITSNPASPFPAETPCLAGTGGWQQVAFDLAAYSGREVLLRFRFGSDGYVVDEGWYIDDAIVTPLSWSNDWVSASATSGVLAARTQTSVSLALNTGPLQPAETRAATIRVEHNVPAAPLVFVPLALHNNSRSITVTSTSLGVISPSGILLVTAGSSTNFHVAANPFCRITDLRTNGVSLPIPYGLASTNLPWRDIESNGVLYAAFTPYVASNGTPQWWLAGFGLTNGSPDVESARDQDGDGMLTWQEFQALTVPTNRDSYAMILNGWTRKAGTGDALVVQWLSFTNRQYTYDLSGASNLYADYEALVSNLAATPPVNVYTIPVPSSVHFFKAEAKRP